MCSVLEVCVDSTASALAAKRGGADRLELCADLIVGGTTPSLTLVQQVRAETGLPVRALLRPRFGDFCYDSYELAQMEQLAAELVEAGADGIVTGVLTPEGELDAGAMQPIYAAARKAAEKAGRPVACTLHRAFDVCADPFAALETARSMGLCTILTRGQAASAPQGAALLRQLTGGQRAAGRCTAAAADRACREGCGDSGRCRGLGTEHPGAGRADRCAGISPFRQTGAAKPHDLPARGRAHGPARLFGV